MRPYNPGGIAMAMPRGTALRPWWGIEVALGDFKSYPIESGVALVGMSVSPLPLRVEVMWTWSVDAWVGRWKLIVCVVDGLIEWSESGLRTVNSISFLTSAFMVVVGKAMVHLLFWECS